MGIAAMACFKASRVISHFDGRLTSALAGKLSHAAVVVVGGGLQFMLPLRSMMNRMFAGARLAATVDAAAALAAERGVRVFTLGFGATERPRGVRIVAVEAPPRVFPGDAFPIKVHLQGSGGSGQTIEVRLASSAVEAATPPRPESSARVEAQHNNPPMASVVRIAFIFTGPFVLWVQL